MTMHATTRKMKMSVTLAPEIVAFLGEARQERGAASNSEVLDLLLREVMLEAKRRQIDAAYKEYYDTASEEDLAEQGQWAELTGPNMFLDIDATEAQQ